MEPDRYAHLSSPVHNWDPRIKAVCLLLFTVVAITVRTLPAVSAVLLLAIALIAFCRLPLPFLFRGLKWPILFLLLMTPVLLLTSGGTPWLRIGSLILYKEGGILACFILLRASTLLLILAALFGTTGLNVLMGALQQLRFPPLLLMLLNFTYRYIFLFREDLKQYFQAAKLRGFSMQQGFRRIGTGINIMTSLLIRSYEQSERSLEAMKLRGFQGSFRSLRTFSLNKGDWLKGLSSVLLLLAVLYLEFML